MKVSIDINLNTDELKIIHWLVQKYNEIEINDFEGIKVEYFYKVCINNKLEFSTIRKKFEDYCIIKYHDDYGYMIPTMIARIIDMGYRG